MKTADDFVRPSAMRQLAQCPGAATMQARAVNWLTERGLHEEGRAETSLGTQCHAITAAIIDSWKLTGEWTQAHEKKDGVDAWSVRCINEAIRFLAALIAKHEIEPDNVLTEQPLQGADYGLPRGGTADVVLVVPFQRVIVLDWKFGFLEQDAADVNDQLDAYALMAHAHFKVKSATVYLYQARMERANRATAATYTAEQLAESAEECRRVCAAARSPSADLSPQSSACTPCKALPLCAAAKEYIVNAQDQFSLIAPETANEHGDLCRAAKLAEKWSEEVISLEKQRLAAGQEVAGFTLASSGTMTKIDAASAIFLATKAGCLDELLTHATFKAEAAKAIEAIKPACSKVDKSPSLKAVAGA